MIRIDFAPDIVEQLRDLHLHHPHPHVRRKMAVLLLKSQEIPHGKIAQIMGLNEETVRRYLRQFQEGGLERLQELRFHQPQSELDQHVTRLEDHFVEHPPHTVRQAQQDIERLTGLHRSLPQVRAFLMRRDLRRLKTGAAPADGDPEEQKQFLEEKIEPRLKEAEQGKRKVFFLDACHPLYRADLGYVWCWTRLYVPSPGGRARCNVLGALDPISLELQTITNTTTVTNQTVQELLRQLRAEHPEGPMTVFLDRAKYQDCAAVHREAARLEIELELLPKGSPNLNLIERLWKWLRQEHLRVETFESFEEFCEIIERALDEIFPEEAESLKTLFAPNFQIIEDIYVLNL